MLIFSPVSVQNEQKKNNLQRFTIQLYLSSDRDSINPGPEFLVVIISCESIAPAKSK